MTDLPTKEAIRQWIAENPTLTAKRDIAKAFGLKGAMRAELKRLLRELEDEGHLAKKRGAYLNPEKLPPVSVLLVTEPDADGDVFARPLEWHGEGPEPRILMIARETDPALAEGDRILARLSEVMAEDHAYEGRLVRRIGTAPRQVLGIFRSHAEGGRIVPIDKGTTTEWTVPAGATHGAKDGELVEAEQAGPRGRMGLPRARITARLGDPSGPKAVSLIAIHQHGIRHQFPEEVIKEADAQKPAGLSGREDLRDLPFVTIDPSDARDHDDACVVLPDPKGGGGHILWVAIADVAHYVQPQSELDREARKRGNSTYFPDRVVPMLPDRLSGDLCSLHEGVPRAVIALQMRIDPDGTKTSHSFHRAMIRSIASLSYEEAQAARDGAPNARTAAMMDEVIAPLFACYESLASARARRQPLDLDLPERQIELAEDGTVTKVAFKDRLEAHRLVEEFMVLANVAAAETLIKKRTPLLFRVHEEPSVEKLDALREVAQASGLTLAKGQVLKTAHLNRLLDQAQGTELAELINISTLRSMTQAYYHPENFGHFGLALPHYAHFTSPIRRYADLLVHRALITAHRWGKDGLSEADIDTLEDTATQISQAERRSMEAERDTTDRYLAAFLADRVGAVLDGRVSGIARFGAFVKLEETGADVLIPMRSLGNEYWHHDRDANTLMGSDSGRVIALGMRTTVKLTEADPVTGGMLAELVSLEGKDMPGGARPERRSAYTRRSKPAGGPKAPRGRKPGPAQKRSTAKARKVTRSRKPR